MRETFDYKALRIVLDRSDTPDGFPDIRKEWQALLAGLPEPSVFLDFDWLRIWWESRWAGRELLVYRIYRADRLVGIAPLMREASRIPGMAFHHLYLLSGEPDPHGAEGVADELDLIWDPRESASKGAFLRYLMTDGDDWCYLHLNCLRSDGDTLRACREVAGRRGALLRTPWKLDIPIARLNGDWEAYTAGLSSKFRKLIRRSFRMIEADHTIEFREYRSPSAIEEALAAMLTIEERSWKPRTGIAIDDARQNRFYETIARHFATRDAIRIWILWAGDRPIAYDLYIAAGDGVTVLKGSYDADYAQYSPGTLLTWAATRRFVTEGIAWIDMMSGSLHYKQKWANSGHVLVGVTLRRPGLRPAIIDYWYHGAVALLARRTQRRLKKIGRRLTSPRPHSPGGEPA